MDIDKTVQFFSLFTDLTGEELEKWRDLCAGAQSRLEKRLRPELPQPLDNIDRERLCTAVAACAYSDYVMLTAGPGGGEIKVGDISLKDSATDVHDIREYFLAQAADLLVCGEQVLLGVES